MHHFIMDSLFPGKLGYVYMYVRLGKEERLIILTFRNDWQ